MKLKVGHIILGIHIPDLPKYENGDIRMYSCIVVENIDVRKYNKSKIVCTDKVSWTVDVPIMYNCNFGKDCIVKGDYVFPATHTLEFPLTVSPINHIIKDPNLFILISSDFFGKSCRRWGLFN